MEEKEFLLTMAQTGLGIAGFSGVMSAFMKRPGRLTNVETYRVAVLLGVSFGAMFLAFLPLALEALGWLGAPLWRTASATWQRSPSSPLTVFLVSSRSICRQAPEIFNRWIFAATALGHVANIVLQIVNVGE